MNWKRKLIWVLLTITLVTPFISSTFKVNIISQTHAHPDNTISITPSNKTDLSLNVGDTFTVNITVDNVINLWQWQFELSFNPDVIHGVWYNETLGYPVEPDPDGFLASEGGTVIVAGGSGWNNTLGKLWLTSANLLLKQKPVNGSGVLARATFKVVSKGESNITLGDNTLLFDLDGYLTTGLGHGYFRNVATTEIPIASFTYSPVGTPEPLEGFYTQFNGTDSTSTGGKTIDEYKWYFWETLNEKLFGNATGSITSLNYTRRGTWKVTLTVIDSGGVIGTTTGNVTIKAHDIAIIDISTDAQTGQWPPGIRYIDIGGILSVNVTVENQGDFTEQHSSGSNFTVTVFYEVTLGVGNIRKEIIDTVNVTTPLAAGANTTLTFQWDTTGNNVTHPLAHRLQANVTEVQYEYEVSDNSLSDPGKDHRVRFHDVAVTKVEVLPHRTLRPNGDGTFTEWTGTYDDWNDWPEHNEDVDYISATADAMNESSTLEDHTIETWSIERVRVTAFARATSLPTEQLILMLVIEGEAYDATGQSPTLSYSEYSYDWETNPATGSDWTWQDIDLLEVGVRSNAIGSWTGEIRVTQLYVEVFGAPPGPVSRGEVTPVKVTVENEGDFNETAIKVTAYYNGDPIGTQTIHLLTNSSFGKPPNFATENYTVTLTFDWNTSGISLKEYTISANTSLVPDDYEPYDNTFLNGNLNVTAPPEPSSISIAASPTSVVLGESVTISGSITPIRTGATVTIWYRTNGATAWNNLTSVLTDNAGQYSYGWTPTAVGTFQFRATWPGDVEYQPAESSVIDVVVGKMSSSISLTVTPTTITFDDTTILSGSLTPARQGETVTIRYRIGGGSWNDLTSVLTDNAGQYSYGWTPTAVGTFQFRATWPGDVEYQPAESSVIDVVVGKMSSSISLTVTPTTITFGNTVTFSGAITPPRAGGKITVWYKTPFTADWKDLLSGFQTDENGEYSWEWGPNAATTWEFKVSWPGDAVTEGAESQIVTVTVLEEERPDFTLSAVAVVGVVIFVVILIYFLKFKK